MKIKAYNLEDFASRLANKKLVSRIDEELSVSNQYKMDKRQGNLQEFHRRGNETGL